MPSHEQTKLSNGLLSIVMYGVLCQILWLGSLAFDTSNDLTVALSTPSTVAPQGAALCFTDKSYSQKLQSISVVSLQASDSLWAAPWREVVPVSSTQQQAASWRSNSFFSSRNGLQKPVEGGTANALLSSDKYYDSSFSVEKWVLAADALHAQHSTGLLAVQNT